MFQLSKEDTQYVKTLKDGDLFIPHRWTGGNPELTVNHNLVFVLHNGGESESTFEVLIKNLKVGLFQKRRVVILKKISERADPLKDRRT